VKVLVTGSRDWTDYEPIFDRLSACDAGTVVIEGGAPGADRLASHAAWNLRLDHQRFPADWKKYGKAAGPIRNLAMLDESPDLVIAFQRNGSRGTQHTVDEARKRGIPVEVHAA
jgi:hypothetical protein